MIGPLRIKWLGAGILLSGIFQLAMLGFAHPYHLPEFWVSLGGLLVLGGIKLERWQHRA